MLSTTFLLDKHQPNTMVYPGFKTGLIFESCPKRGILIRHGIQVTIREFLTRRIVFNEELEWHTNTSIALVPGKYIIDFYVEFFGRQIWTYKGFFVVDEGAPTHLMLDTPKLITSEPRVVFR